MAGVIDIATYSARLELNDKSFISGMQNAEKQGRTSSTNLNSTFSNLSSTLLKVGSIFGVGMSIKSFIDDASEAEAGISQLNTVLASTKNAVGLTADEISNMAGELQKVTKFSDDEILSGQNLLLTFTNIGKDVFPQVTETMLDMSQALGQDLKSSSIQLGKAINDPINGVTALQRVGVSFTDSQKNQIKTMQESGDVMGAQKLILAELSKEFGGSAKAAGETYAGQMARLKNQLGEVSESIGGKILPYLSQFANYIIANMPKIRDSIDNAITKAGQIVDGLAKAIKFVIDNSNILIPIVGGLAAALTALSVINTVKGLMDAWKLSTLAQTLAQGGLNAVMSANPIGIVITAIGLLVGAGIALYMNWDKVSAFLITVWDNIKKVASDTFSAIGTAISNTWDNIKLATENIWNGIKSFFITLWDGIVWIFKNLTIVGIITSHWDDIKRVTENVFNGLKTFFTGIWDGIVLYIGGLSSSFSTLGTNLFNSLWDGIKGVWTNITSWVEDKMNWLKDKLTFWKSSQDKMSTGGGGASISVPQYAVGTPFVPDDQLALIHKGEAIIPAQYNPYNSSNTNMNNSSGSSGDTLSFAGANFNFTTHDGFDANTFVKDLKRISKTTR